MDNFEEDGVLEPQASIRILKLLVRVLLCPVVNEILVAIDAPLFISRSRIDHIPVSEHRPPFVRYVENVPVALLTLFVLERSIGSLSVFLVVVCLLDEVDEDVLCSVGGFCKEELKSLMRGGEMAIHAVSYKSLGIVYMG
jgi:hypothetical protein